MLLRNMYTRNSKLLQHDLLSMLAPYLDVRTAAHLMCASKCLAAELQQIVPRLLMSTARQAANGNELISVPPSVLSTWLQKFPVPDICMYRDALLRNANLSLGTAAALVGVGLRMSYQQFLSAVHAGVPGVQVWVQAYDRHNLPPLVGMHPLALGMCRGQDVQRMLQVPQDITPVDLADLLHLVITMPRNGNATSGLCVLCERPEAQGMESTACLKLLQAAVQVGASERVQALLDKLPAAQQLPQDNVVELLHAAVQARLWFTVRLLCNLPAAQDVTAATTFSLLQAGVLAEGAATVRAVCRLPSTQGLTTGQAAELLHAAVQTKDSPKVLTLVQLRAALAVPAATVAELIAEALAAAETGLCHEMVAALCGLPGAQGIDSNTLQGLLHTAVQLQPVDQQATVKLCSLTSTQLLETAAMKRLLQMAVAAGGSQKVIALLQAPSARDIGQQAALELLHTAVTSSEFEMTTWLLQAYSEHYRTAGRDAAHILQAAARAGMWRNVTALCRASVEASIDADVVTELLAGALTAPTPAHHDGFFAIDALLDLSAAQQLSVQQYTPLLQMAVAAGGRQKVIALLRASCSRDIGQQAALELLHMAATSSECEITARLLQAYSEHYRAVGRDAAHILQATGHAGMWRNVTALCKACVEASVDADVITELLAGALAAVNPEHDDSKEAIAALLELSATRQLSVQQYTPLLLTAAASKPLHSVLGHLEQWLKLPAAEQVDASTVHTALNLVVTNEGKPRVVAALLKLPAATSIQTSDLADSVRAAARSQRWLPALAIIQGSAATAAAVEKDVFLDVLAHSLAAHSGLLYPLGRLWDTTSRCVHTRLLEGTPTSLGLRRVLNAANLESVISGATGVLAGKAAAVLRWHLPVGVYADLIMVTVAAVATGQLLKAEQLSEALLAQLLVAVGHVWTSYRHQQRLCAAVDQKQTRVSRRVPQNEAYARTTVSLLDFLSQQGLNPGRILCNSEGGVAAARQVTAALERAKVLAKGLCRLNSADISQGVKQAATMSVSAGASLESATGTRVVSVEQPGLTEISQQKGKTLNPKP